MVIRCSSVSTLTRIDWLATRSASEASVSPGDLAAADLAAGLASFAFAAGLGFSATGADAAAAGAGAV